MSIVTRTVRVRDREPNMHQSENNSSQNSKRRTTGGIRPGGLSQELHDTYLIQHRHKFSDYLEVVDIVGKGRGVRALQPIEEHMYIDVPGKMWCIPKAGHAASKNFRQHGAQFLRDYPHLLGKVAGLHNPSAHPSPPLGRKILLEDVYANIFKRNQWSYNGGNVVSVDTGSMFNHSCALTRPKPDFVSGHEPPTEFYVQIPGNLTIQAGDEVCFSYLNEADLRLDVHARRHLIWDTWGFLCKCERCLFELQETTDDELLCRACHKDTQGEHSDHPTVFGGRTDDLCGMPFIIAHDEGCVEKGLRGVVLSRIHDPLNNDIVSGYNVEFDGDASDDNETNKVMECHKMHECVERAYAMSTCEIPCPNFRPPSIEITTQPPPSLHEQVVNGFKWTEYGLEEPNVGRELQNTALSKALSYTTEFTQEEWDDFGIDNLQSDDYIKVHCSALYSYFVPVPFAVNHATVDEIESLEQLETRMKNDVNNAVADTACDAVAPLAYFNMDHLSQTASRTSEPSREIYFSVPHSTHTP